MVLLSVVSGAPLSRTIELSTCVTRALLLQLERDCDCCLNPNSSRECTAAKRSRRWGDGCSFQSRGMAKADPWTVDGLPLGYR